MRLLCWMGLLGLVLSVRGGEPPRLPPPMHVEPGFAPPSYQVPYYYRVSAYAVWDNYAVDRKGVFRPRVIETPRGAYRLIDGRPYPWITTHTTAYMPYATD